MTDQRDQHHGRRRARPPRVPGAHQGPEAPKGEDQKGKPDLIDVSVPNAARAGDFLRGGRDNFEADRKAAREVVASAPAIERIPAEARAFRNRVVKFLAESGIRQFLDIGNGMVPPGTTHEVAQAIAPDARIVYTDTDPMVLNSAQAQIKSTPDGVVAFVDGDIDDVDAILAVVKATLDFGQPVGVLLLSTLAHVPTTIAATRAVTSLMAAMPADSYVAIYHLASDLDPGMLNAARQWNKTAPTPITLRSRTDVLAMVAGLELVPPGAVPVTEWRPEPVGQGEPVRPVPVHGVVARKP